MKRILIVYSHFSPAYKAGGPVQSIINLVNCIQSEYRLYILCSAYEMGEAAVLQDILADSWNQYSDHTRVYYAAKISWSVLKKVYKEVDPEIVYINGLYTPYYSLLPHYLALRQNRKIILAPRGMLQSGALAVKPFKKKIFFLLFKILGFNRNVAWHATDKQEEQDIKSMFVKTGEVKVLPNIPKAPPDLQIHRPKVSKSLSLIFLSLITEKKNLHLALEALRMIKTPVQFDIYGPVKDHLYWKKCMKLMEDSIHTIKYYGPVEPKDVQAILQKYHVFILPTKGENFGHAIYEALSAGTVPIISPFTPWGDLQKSNAGVTVTGWDVNEWSKAIEKLLHSDQHEFDKLSANAFKIAKSYFETNDFKSLYKNLFG